MQATPRSSGFVLSAALAGAAELITSLDQDPALIAEESGVPPQALRDPELPLRGEAIGRFVHLAAQKCECRNFGLLLSSQQSWSILGPVWFLMTKSETLGEVLEKLEANFAFYATAAVFSLRQDDTSSAALCYDVTSDVLMGEVQAVELGLAIAVRELGALIRPGWHPDGVQFRHHSPADPSMHREIFGSGIRFNQDRNAILLNRDLLDRDLHQRPLDAGNRSDLAVLQKATRYRPRSSVIGIRIRTENAIRALLPHNQCSLENVAAALGQSRRTLQSHLSVQGTTFQEISDRVRRLLAEKYLVHSDLTVGQIAELLQFSETSSFTRFFKSQQSVTPRDYRRINREG